MEKITKEGIKNLAHKGEIFEWDGYIVCLINIGNSRFIEKYFYPIDFVFYSPEEKYRNIHMAKINKISVDEFIKILNEERDRIKSYYDKPPEKEKSAKIEKKPTKPKKTKVGVVDKSNLLDILRANAKQK